jgi:hypothetical protein
LLLLRCCCVVVAVALLLLFSSSIFISFHRTFCQDCHNVWDPCCNSHHVDCTSHLLHDDDRGVLIVPSSVVVFVISPPCSTLILLLLLLVMTSVSRRTWRRRNGHCRNNAPFSGYSLSISPLLCTSPCNGCSRGLGEPPPSQSHSLPGLLEQHRAAGAASKQHLIKLHNWAMNLAASFSPREPARSNCARCGSTSIAGGGAPTLVVHQHVFANSEMGGAHCSEMCFRMKCKKLCCE